MLCNLQKPSITEENTTLEIKLESRTVDQEPTEDEAEIVEVREAVIITHDEPESAQKTSPGSPVVYAITSTPFPSNYPTQKALETSPVVAVSEPERPQVADTSVAGDQDLKKIPGSYLFCNVSCIVSFNLTLSWWKKAAAVWHLLSL